MKIEKRMTDSLHKNFINKSVDISDEFEPEFLVNDPDNQRYVLTTLSKELRACASFTFSVAFITKSGLMLLKQQLLTLKEKGVRGRIVTSNYLGFNSPAMFEELLKLENVDVRIFSGKGFHTKGYLFDFDEHHSIIIGSSNLTSSALKENSEWNMKVTSLTDGAMVEKVKSEIDKMWLASKDLTNEWIDMYAKTYQKPNYSNSVNNSIKMDEFGKEVVEPNKMQEVALASIAQLRESGKRKAMVISATGTGKTYLAAFDVNQFKPKKMLFIVHREQILKKAKADFFKIIGGKESDFGILSGNSKSRECKYIFATVQTISKAEEYNQFSREDFDYILIDEVHRAGAQSYLNILDYFNPTFLMGMTATPERTDSINIFELFDYNIAYEIRLQQALEEDMLCPFHYYGITDYEKDGEISEKTTDIAILASNERVNHIVKHAEYFGYSGDALKGLIFCGKVKEAKELVKLLNQRGYRTVVLTGKEETNIREREVQRLEDGELDYIVTVDIFNEGIDIPCVNQIIMLRATKSSIIFIQQLGRGLRKDNSKEYVTIIDFIGNYKTNYLIPVALSGDTSLNKNNLLKKTLELEYLKGVSSINFDEISKQRIFTNIQKESINNSKNRREEYLNVKNRLGRIPFLMDFIEQNSIDPLMLTTDMNYYQFLIKMTESVPVISQTGNFFLTMLSREIMNGLRPHELLLLKQLLTNEELSISDFKQILDLNNCYRDEKTVRSVTRILDLSFHTVVTKKTYGNLPIITSQNDNIRLTTTFVEELRNSYFKKMVEDIIEVGLLKSKNYDSARQLSIKEKYTRKDTCRLLNWDNNEEGTINGYRVKHGTCPIFITYKKELEEGSSIDFKDEFINPQRLNWSSTSPRTLDSVEIKRLMNLTDEKIDLHIFIQRKKKDDFFYFGLGEADNRSAKNEILNGKKVIHIEIDLEQPVDHVLYEFFQTK